MQDRPNVRELLELSAQFLEREIIPTTKSSIQFHARIVANVMRIVIRELQIQEPQLQAEISALAVVLESPLPLTSTLKESRKAALELNEELSERIRAGDADKDPWRKAVFKVVRNLVEEKLRVANPRYLEGDRAARARAER